MITDDDIAAVTAQLGRAPRGMLEVSYRCPNGEPAVVKTAPRLPDGTPFPTLYYLTHPALTAAASRLESGGLMREMTERLAVDEELGPPIGGRTRATSPSVMPSNRSEPPSPQVACPTGSSVCTC
ncbi:septum formation initiator subfamily protein [Mycobacteroides abscessus]|nr:septum formation initiator subfamily protein [Mycobacteroides abscessus]